MRIRNYPLREKLCLNGKIMELEVLRVSSQEDSTSGILFKVVDGKREFICYVLEDQQQTKKVMHETRIPAGTYEIKLRNVGGFHARYTKRYGDMHKGCLHIIDVPNFKYILIHTGNTDDHTSGCLIVGETQKLTREVEYLTRVVKVLETENKDLKEQLAAATYAVQDIVSYTEGDK